MDLKQIEKLMAAMGRTGIKKLSLKEETFELQLERGDEGIDRSFLANAYSDDFSINTISQKNQVPPLAAGHINKPLETTPEEIKEDTHSQYVTSPMVGTFYAAASPHDPAFVKVGDVIDENTIVYIIEAMKVMNEVKAGVKGTVAEVLLKNGEPVEFGTKILRVI